MTVRAYRQEMAEAERFVEMNERYLESNIRLARVRGDVPAHGTLRRSDRLWCCTSAVIGSSVVR